MEIEKIFSEIKKLINVISNLGQPNWLDYVQLVLTALGVGISIWAVKTAASIPKEIAYRQDKVALFDKRIRYYQTCHIILDGCKYGRSKQQVEDDLENQHLEFVCYDSDGARFLFDEETASFINDVFSNWLKYSNAVFLIKSYSDNDNTKEPYEEYMEEYKETIKFFESAREQLPRKFEGYFKMI